VEMTTTGFLVNGKKAEWSQLFERVKSQLAGSHQSAVFLKIDDDVEYGEAVRLLDLCRGAGAQILAIPPGTHG
jgi:biopolymer transport protein ExbD